MTRRLGFVLSSTETTAVLKKASGPVIYMVRADKNSKLLTDSSCSHLFLQSRKLHVVKAQLDFISYMQPAKKNTVPNMQAKYSP